MKNINHKALKLAVWDMILAICFMLGLGFFITSLFFLPWLGFSILVFGFFTFLFFIFYEMRKDECSSLEELGKLSKNAKDRLNR